ncbi:Two component system, signal transduction histidine kinase [Acididesulfobacillus acetoxydans]|uniref:histidine kinase n=1 Tax=Acididesulfobacillus acetoxydans TaxID=1561005 RepID=A0A8S0XVQ6_9FIRM|nr:ATP-binding protein [Acididesulfobacillus acetoxydans]CAA7600527.1 Two component system, signal transduction histidine kinase [Acididesulfobacillus acetoxydans]CEJ06661.1 Sensor histidine kinase ResE [Acididesulfobacillus acetoxydans]
MIFRSFAGKIWFVIVAWVFLVLLIFGGILAKSTHDFYYGYSAEESEELNNTASSMAAHLASLPDIKAGQADFALLGSVLNYDLVATDPSGRVLLATHEMRNWNHYVMPEADMAILRRGGHIAFSGNAPYETHPILKVAYPIRKDGKIIGGVFVIEPMTYLEAVGRSVRVSSGWGLTLSFLLTLPLGLYVARRVANPVVEMDRAIKDIATGNYSRLLPLSSTDELSSLGRSVNTLSTEIRLNLREIAHERQLLASILASIADGVLSLTPDREIVMANRVAMKQFGSRAPQPAGKGIPKSEPDQECALCLHDLPDSLHSLLLESLCDPVPHKGDFRVEDRVFQVETTPLMLDQECGGTVAVWHDVTKERRLDEMRREFISDVSHELRTPLSYLQGYSEALLDEVITDEAQKKRYLETILKETLRLRSLVNELLDLSRIEFDGSRGLPHEQVSVPHVLSLIKDQTETAAQEKPVRLTLDLPPNLPPVDCSTDRLEQIILNLLDNALRFSPPGGEIILSCRSGYSWVEISVQDQGPGIPSEERDSIWNRFDRGGRTQAPDTGTGLGLAIVRSLVQAYGGEVALSSELGKGSTFSIRLPVFTPS